MRRVALSLALVATLSVAACTTDAAQPNTPFVPHGTATAAPSSGGTVAWQPCGADALDVDSHFPRTLTASCATVTVPADWRTAKNGTASDGKTFSIRLVKIHKISDANPIGNVLTNPGGPGASGYEFAIQIASEYSAEMSDLLSKFDLVGFDPRGVGRSNPVDCISDADLAAYYGYDPDPVSDAAFQGLITLDKHMGDSCATKYGSSLGLFATEQAARDIDAIRAALGDQKVNWLGFSYGTLLGATYAQLFPAKVRSMVLDGAVDPTQTAVALSEGQAAGFEHAFDDFAAWCKAHPGECPIADNPRGEVMNAINTARTQPVVGPGGRKVTSGLVALAVVQALYRQDFWTYLAQGIAGLKHNDSTYILALADQYADRHDDGTYGNETDIFNAVECADSTYPTVEQIRALQAQWRAKYPMFGASLATGLLNCAEWPAPKDLVPTGKAAGAPPIVVVGTTGDPATPYANTAKLATMLGNSTVVTWQGEGHTAYLSSGCVRAAINAYLINLTVPPSGLTCPPT